MRWPRLAIGLKDWTKMTDDQFKQASDFLREVHKNVRSYWTDTTDIVQPLSGGEVDLAWAWNDAAVQSVAAGVPIRAKKDTDEGISTWVCGYVLLQGCAGNADKAYDYLNAVNDPAIRQRPGQGLGLWPGQCQGHGRRRSGDAEGKGL